MTEIAVGIDLGTTNSCVAVYKNDVEIIANEEGHRVTPSWVCFSDDGILVGDQAVDNAHQYVKNTIYESKRLIGQNFDDEAVQTDIDRFPFEVFNDLATPKIRINHNKKVKELYPEEISAYILMKLKAAAEKHLSQCVRRVVVTVPAYFNEAQRQATKTAGSIAGFTTVNIINEPTAAALSYNYKNQKKYERKILVYDFGGGTFDVSIVSVEPGKCAVLATKGDSHLGGTDIDWTLFRYVKNDYESKFGSLADNIFTTRRIKSYCEKIKKRLSNSTQESIELLALEGKDYIGKITRAHFDDLNDETFNKTMEIMKECLQDSGLQKSDIDEVALVGGSSRIPRVKELLKNYFGADIISEAINPDEAVALGAAIYASDLIGNKAEVEDVTSLSLGTNILGDVMSVIVPRNTPIPISRNKKYKTTKDNQSSMTFPIFQGEREIASENKELAKFTLVNLPPGPANSVIINVCLEINKEGMLNVTATETTNNTTISCEVNMSHGHLSEEDIKRCIEEAEKYKEEDAKKKLFLMAINDLEKVARDIEKKTDFKDAASRNTVLRECSDTLTFCSTTENGDAAKIDDMKNALKKLYFDNRS